MNAPAPPSSDSLPVGGDDALWRAIVLDSASVPQLLIRDGEKVLWSNDAAQTLLDLGLSSQDAMLSELIDDTRSLQRALSGPVTERRRAVLHPARVRAVGGHRTFRARVVATPHLSLEPHDLCVVEIFPLDSLHPARDNDAAGDAAAMLLRNLAHELKNPLGGIRGAAQLLGGTEDDEVGQVANIIISEVDRLVTLIDSFDRDRHSRPALKEGLNIHEPLERARKLVESETGPKLVVERDYDPSLPIVAGNADLLVQVFLNLMRNAVQAMDGEGTLSLCTRIERMVVLNGQRHRLAVRVDVIDEGPGVPPELAEQIFLPLVTGRAQGSGLGLSIVMNIVRALNGHVGFLTEPGETTFSVILPLWGNEDGDA